MTQANAAAAVADLMAFGINANAVQVGAGWEVVVSSNDGLDNSHVATVATTYSATTLTLTAKLV